MASPGERCTLENSDVGPRRGPVRGVAKVTRRHRGDGLHGIPTGFTGECSLSPGTPGLYAPSGWLTRQRQPSQFHFDFEAKHLGIAAQIQAG